ncbi:MAG: hypothetical protein ACOX2G_12635 [Bacillota bacterium]|jgi:uncharacterized membrane protein YcaP (DUF421 family)
MQTFLSLVVISLYFLWFRLYGKAMIAAQEWPDLAVSLGLAGLSLYYAWAVIWDVAIQFPTHYLTQLLMPLIRLVYGNWL